MKKIGLIILTAGIVGCQPTENSNLMVFQDDMDKVSYSIGVDIGKSFEQQKLDLVSEFLVKGISDAMNDDVELMMAAEEMEICLNDFREKRNKQLRSEGSDLKDKNTKEGEEFLAANKSKEGVITTASGLQYKVITEGTGATPKKTDTVETHYRGTLINGKEFDSSYSRGETTSFGVSQVIAGWTEALLLMKVGSKLKLFIPPDLAYGSRGASGDIGPNATLIFDIELISIK
jgi:FKBP-type peptidyl-prolyl cis-trans isomerase FklB